MFFAVFDLFLPMLFVLILVPVWYLFFSPSWELMLRYAPVLIGGVVILLLALIWIMPPVLKFIVFSRCPVCAGSGRLKISGTG